MTSYDGPAISHMRRPPPREPATRPACEGAGRLFSSTDPDLAAEAAAICLGCRFKACRDIARELTAGERSAREGTWDGVLYVNGRRREKPKPINHGSVSGARAHRARGEKPCDPCRLAENAKRLADRRKQEAAS